MGKDFMFTSESTTAGHPDKLCDQISDAIVDRFLQLERTARVRAECAVSGGIVFLAARFSSSVEVDLADLARHVIRQNGYTEGEFNADDCTVMTNLHALDSEAILRVDVAELGAQELDSIVAANQVTAFGFACDQTPEMMPLPIMLAHQLAQRLSRVGLEQKLPYIMPDGKTQVGIEYRGGKPQRIHSINLVTAHREDLPVTLAAIPWQGYQAGQQDPAAGQPWRAVRQRRSRGAFRLDRAQDGCRHLRGVCKAQRVGTEREGPPAHRSGCRLCRASCREKCRRGGTGHAV